MADECLGAAVVFERNTWLSEERAVWNLGSVPVSDVCGWLGDDEAGSLLWQFLGYRSDGVAKPESGKPDQRLASGAEWGAGEPSQLFLRRTGGRTANLLTVDQQGFPAIVLLEREDITVWKLSFCEVDSWFHGA